MPYQTNGRPPPMCYHEITETYWTHVSEPETEDEEDDADADREFEREVPTRTAD